MIKCISKLVDKWIGLGEEAITENAGIYCFYLQTIELTTTALEDYWSMFQSESVSVEIIENPLGNDKFKKEKYLRSEYIAKELKNNSQIKANSIGSIKPHHQKALEMVSREFTPPIYIGHTDNLRERAYSHFDDLDLLSNAYKKKLHPGNSFSERIKGVGDFYSANHLKLKIIFDEDGNLTKKDYRILESYILSVTRPILSLK